MAEHKQKIVLYSHDTLGLGHMRRNLAIAQSLIKGHPGTAILMIAGAHEAGAFAMPHGVDCLTLPTLAKDDTGQYQPRSLSVPRSELLKLRAKTIRTAVEMFEPDVLIADKVPSGAFEELIPSLDWLQTQRHTRCILGLREVLDEPEVVQNEWDEGEYESIVETYYDAVWIYGDRQIYDPIYEYDFSGALQSKTRFTGYLGRLMPDSFDEENQFMNNLPSDRRIALCMVGGGQDGQHLAETFIQTRMPANTTGVLVTGPYMPLPVRQRMQKELDGKSNIQMLTFVNEPERLIKRADSVIAMGGYNTVCEILSAEKPALIVPRVKPRREQLIRAERLANAGVIDYLHPDKLSHQALQKWLNSDASTQKRTFSHVDLDGLKRLPGMLREAMNTVSEWHLVSEDTSAQQQYII